eukprot:SAG31_NODE_3615_length_4066_cov_3.735316_4_plen_75_part_00
MRERARSPHARHPAAAAAAAPDRSDRSEVDDAHAVLRLFFEAVAPQLANDENLRALEASFRYIYALLDQVYLCN